MNTRLSLLAMLVALGTVATVLAPTAATAASGSTVRLVVETGHGVSASTLAAYGDDVTPPGLEELGLRSIVVPASQSEHIANALRGRGVAVEPTITVRATVEEDDPGDWGPAVTNTDDVIAAGQTAGVPTVAVLDTGVAKGFSLRQHPGYDFVADDAEPLDESANLHGTSVALVAAAGRYASSPALAGYCPTCAVLPVRVLDAAGEGTSDRVAAGIVYAAKHADVINMSFAGYADDPPDDIAAAIEYAVGRGVVLVAAAGNEHQDLTLRGKRSWPAAFPDVMGVAASRQDDRLYKWSTRGSWVDMAAPGCHRVMSDEPAFCGTSASAPAVAGAVGLLRHYSRRIDDDTARMVLSAGAARTGVNVAYGRLDTLASADVLLDGQPVPGNWHGGVSRPGWFHDGTWWIRKPNGSVKDFRYGRAGDVPVVGDWDGDGDDTVGIVRNGRWHLRNSLSGGYPTWSFTYGRVLEGDVPLVGDWDADGEDTIGIVRNGRWHLRNVLKGGVADRLFTYGRVLQGDIPVTGDWLEGGRDLPGIVRGGRWHLRHSLRGGPADASFSLGDPGAGFVPVVGDWDNDGDDNPGTMTVSTWLMTRDVERLSHSYVDHF